MADWYSKTWKPVTASGLSREARKSAAGFQSISHSEWYSDMLHLASDRLKQLDQYDQMDSMSVDISRALDIIAEDVASDGADNDGSSFDLKFPEEMSVNKTKYRTYLRLLRMWEKETKFRINLFDHVREVLKYGAKFFLEEKNGTLKELNHRAIVGYKVKKDDPTVITHYIYDTKQLSNKGVGDVGEKKLIPIEDLLILKVGNGPFGESVLKRVYKAWRQLQLLEDAVVIYRIVRAPERRVFYIDTGRLSNQKAEAYIERIKTRMQQKQLARGDTITSNYNPASMQEDFFIGTNSEGKGSRVETLPGGDNLGQIQDLQYFNKKLALGLRIPPSYLDNAYVESQSQGMHNDGRLGMAYMAELRYIGYVKRIQRFLAEALSAHFLKFAIRNDVEIPEEANFIIIPPQSFAEYRKNELYNTLMNTVNSAINLEGMSKSYAFEKYLMLDKEEIEENEMRVLMERGLSREQIKNLTEEQRMNIVYGDGSALGAETDEENDPEEFR